MRLSSKYIWLVCLFPAAACNLTPSVPVDPPSSTPIVGGIPDQRPYFGTATNPLTQQVEDFMLATCGCGEWRVLMTPRDNSGQWQFPVHFYTTNPTNDPTLDVTAYGREEDRGMTATIKQSDGLLNGITQRGWMGMNVSATRREQHTNDATTCVACHIGDNPIWPQPPGHPHFELNPPNCLSCHNVTIE